jgi:hypothetical protein
VSPGPLLIANLGAEEGEAGIAAAARAGSRAAELAELWRGLFEPPVFPWLAGIQAAAWWNDSAAEREAGQATLLGADAETVRRLHDKAWAIQLAEAEFLDPPILRGLATDFSAEALRRSGAAEEIARVLESWPEWAREQFTLKPRIGTSGRGRVAGSGGRVNDEMRGGFERLADRGGAVLEPWLERLADASAQLHIAEDGTVTLLGTLEIVATAAGQPRGHRGELDSRGRPRTGLPEEEALREAAGIAGGAAAREGYRGPCGIDAIVFRAAGDGTRSFRPLVEFNARFTAGIVALGQIRRHLGRIKDEMGLAPGDLFHFYVGHSAAVPTGSEQIWRVSLLDDGEASGASPVLLVSREREVVDAWLSASA